VHQEGLLKNYARRPLAMGLQMSVAEYASYDAVGLAELGRKREVSPTELVEAAIDRIEKAQNAPTISETQAMPNPKSIML